MNELRDTDRIALQKLLGDDDPHVLDLLEERFSQMGAPGLAFLETMAGGADVTAARGATRILQTIRQRNAWDAFARFCATCGSQFDLETACWLLAQTRYPELDEKPYHARLDQMARELRERLTSRETPRATIEVCSRYLFRTLGFTGNRKDYYDPDNSYLNRVLDRRLGIPISLGALYLLVGKRLNLPLVGIGMPGHFLLKWQSAATEFLVDAFNEGQIPDEQDCRQICESSGHAFTPATLAPVTSRQILLRMCHNLHAIYADTDPPRAEQFGRSVAQLSHH
jgi:regulator of sirC expression with transglutaminase-like and TPR domain